MTAYTEDLAGDRQTTTGGSRLIRFALLVDAVVAGVNGLAYLALADTLDSLLGLPTAVLRAAGGFLVAYASLVWFLGTRRPPPAAAVWAVIAANAVWALDSVVLVAAGWFSPSTAGNVWILLQAATVAAFALVQWWAQGAESR